ncbi:hypothetical protein ATANTOWER_023565 [Ataeniobius toweri]|uniref:Uncharacterized protein n=1 Tax=Ataeniobius toweri TaxID=208326 RepID=A0ABU7BU64_9TELE|nr:hypothetical protein [Ataeniobius toweri]
MSFGLDHQVRDGAMSCLVEIYRHVGERVRLDLSKKGLPQSRLNVIFSKFDEVQRSGNMIPCSGSGEFLFGFAPHRSAPLPVVSCGGDESLIMSLQQIGLYFHRVFQPEFLLFSIIFISSFKPVCLDLSLDEKLGLRPDGEPVAGGDEFSLQDIDVHWICQMLLFGAKTS